MLRSLSLTALLCSGPFLTAEDTPLFSLEMPNAQRTVERFQASLYGQALAAEGAAEGRAMAEAALSQMLMMVGIDSFQGAISAAKGMEIQALASPDGDEPQLTIQIRGADLHQPIINAFTRGREGEALEAPEGLEQAVQVRRSQVYGIGGDRLVLANDVAALHSLPASDSDEDVVFSWNGPQFADLMKREFERELRPIAGVLIPSGSVGYSLVPEGLQSTMRIPSAAPAVGRISSTELAWVPADITSVLAINIKPGEWIRRKAAEATASLEAQGMAGQYPTLPQLLAMADQGLGMAGFPVSSADLLDGAHGTVVLAIGAGNGLIPTISIALPRSQAIDQSLEWALQRAGHGPVADGQLAFLTLRGLMDMPMMVTGLGVLRTEGQWIVSTDSVMLGDYLAGKLASWSTSASAQALLAQKPFLMAWGDARKSLSLLVPLAGIGASQAMGGILADDAVAVAHRLASRSGDATLLGTTADGGLVITAKGPLGGMLAGVV